MANATKSAAATTTATTGEINYFFKDENGKILKVIKQEEIKREPRSTTSVVYTTNSANNSNMGAYGQVNSSNQHFVRLPSNYNSQQGTTYTVITPQNGSNRNNSQQQNMATVKYETADRYNTTPPQTTTVVKSEDRYATYHMNNKSKSKMHTTHSTNSTVQRKRKLDKAGKGLRYFSMKVCEKVKEKGTTTYNEVADELVSEEDYHNKTGKSSDSPNCDQKNIRRRVYDALNVLMAMEIISKDKKDIRWMGLPSDSLEECSAIEKENEERRERINKKHQQLRELLQQQVSFKSLIERNKESERKGSIPTPNSSIQLPFIIVNTHKATKINCSVTNDKSEYFFKFNDKFEMHDDAEVLKRMGLLCGLDKGECSYEDIERAKSLVPPNFEKYIEAYGNGRGVGCDSDDELTTYELSNDMHNSFARALDDGPTHDIDEDDELLEHSDND